VKYRFAVTAGECDHFIGAPGGAANAQAGIATYNQLPREALIKFHMRDRGDSGRGQDGEDAV
jgi:hypothetical protein